MTINKTAHYYAGLMTALVLTGVTSFNGPHPPRELFLTAALMAACGVGHVWWLRRRSSK